MIQVPPHPTDAQRHLVQRVVAGGIPVGKDFDACRALLVSEAGEEEERFKALFTLLEGALAEPFFPIADTREVVQILKSLARGDLKPEQLL